jgi:hypothetical protein
VLLDEPPQQPHPHEHDSTVLSSQDGSLSAGRLSLVLAHCQVISLGQKLPHFCFKRLLHFRGRWCETAQQVERYSSVFHELSFFDPLYRPLQKMWGRIRLKKQESLRKKLTLWTLRFGAPPPPAWSVGCQRCEPSRLCLSANRTYRGLLATGLRSLVGLELARPARHF